MGLTKRIVGIVGVGWLTLLLMLSGTGWPAAAQDDPAAAATATRAAELAELERLRTQVASMPTPTPAATGEAALAGRLGGPRESFTAAYGEPVRYFGPDQVEFNPDGGDGVARLTVTFSENQATQILLAPDRPAAKPPTEPDPADWSLAEAREIAGRFLPADASLEEAAPDPGAEGELIVDGRSAALGEPAGEPAADGCPDPRGGAWRVRLTVPAAEAVSLVTLSLLAAPDRAEGDVAAGAANGNQITTDSSSSSVSTSEINGIRVTFEGNQQDPAEGSEPPPPGTRYVAAELAIANRRAEPYRIDLADFSLIDASGGTHAAICGGAEPAISGGELAPGEAIRGWLTFALPDGVAPERLTYELTPGSTVNIGWN